MCYCISTYSECCSWPWLTGSGPLPCCTLSNLANHETFCWCFVISNLFFLWQCCFNFSDWFHYLNFDLTLHLASQMACCCSFVSCCCLPRMSYKGYFVKLALIHCICLFGFILLVLANSSFLFIEITQHSWAPKLLIHLEQSTFCFLEFHSFISTIKLTWHQEFLLWMQAPF